MRGSTEETRLAHMWCARLDRALLNLQNNNILVRIDRRKRQATTSIHIICYDLTTATRIPAVARSVGRRTTQAQLNPQTGVWEIPYTYTSDTGSGSFGTRWVMNVTLSQLDSRPRMQFGNLTGACNYGGKITFTSDVDYKVLPHLCTQLFADVAYSPALDDPTKYSTKMKLYKVPTPNDLIAVFVDPNMTQAQLCTKLHDHFSITLAEAYSPIVVESLQQLPNN